MGCCGIYFCSFREKVYKDTLGYIITSSRAEGTVKKYQNAIAGWKVWCRLNKIDPETDSSENIARYFVDMFNSGAPYSRIESAFFGIKWNFDSSPRMCNNNPCNSKFLHLLLDGFKRIMAKPVVRKEPITADILFKIVHMFNADNLKDVRLCTMFLISYAAFLRYDELSNLRICDVDLCDSHVKLFLEKSKTDQLREGSWVIVAKTGKTTCPVTMLQRYLNLAEISDFDCQDFLFRPISLLKSCDKYVLRSGKLSYTRCREILKESLDAVGLNSKEYGLHSLRAGGASAAAAIGVPDRLFKRHGRWKSEDSKDRYIKESLQNKLLVSMNLGI